MAVPRTALSRRPYGSDQQDACAPPFPAGRSPPRRQISFSSSASTTRETSSTTYPAFMTAIAHTQAQAQAFLLTAITSERAKRWPEAIEYYRRLLKCLSKRNFPAQYVPAPTCKLLVFETYYHIGVAFQNMHNHHEALEEFTLALETAYIPKNVSQVGCASGSFYQIPVLARRTYSYVKCDKIKEAIRDSTRAVHLDSSNPDVYCIRALVWSSAKEKRRALVDLNVSYKLNPSHVCTLILRGAILNSLGSLSSQKNKDHEKALALSWDSKNFYDVEDFYNPNIPSFYDKFLWSLNAFHTITEINLFDGATFATNLNITRGMGESSPRGPLRCGSLIMSSKNTSFERRKTYTQTVRQSAAAINVKKDSSSSITAAKKDSSSSSSVIWEPVKKDLSSSLSWGFEKEELKNYEANAAKEYFKKGSDSAADWLL